MKRCFLLILLSCATCSITKAQPPYVPPFDASGRGYVTPLITSNTIINALGYVPESGGGSATNIGLGSQNSYIVVSTNGTGDFRVAFQTNILQTLSNRYVGSFNGNVVNVFNVQQYGAIGDGSTDDSAAILKAVQAWTNAGGGILYFPTTSSFYKDLNSGYILPVPTKGPEQNFGTAYRIVSDGMAKVKTSAATYLTCTNGRTFPAIENMVFESVNGIAASNVFCFNMLGGGSQNNIWRQVKVLGYGLGLVTYSTVVDFDNCTFETCYNGFQHVGYSDECHGRISVAACTNGAIIGGNNLLDSHQTVEQSDFTVDSTACMYPITITGGRVTTIKHGAEGTIGAEIVIGDPGHLPRGSADYDFSSIGHVIVHGMFSQPNSGVPGVLVKTNCSGITIEGYSDASDDGIIKFSSWYAASNTCVNIPGLHGGNIILPDNSISGTKNVAGYVLWGNNSVKGGDFDIFNATLSTSTPRFQYDSVNDKLLVNSTTLTALTGEMDYNGKVKVTGITNSAFFEASQPGDHVLLIGNAQGGSLYPCVGTTTLNNGGNRASVAFGHSTSPSLLPVTVGYDFISCENGYATNRGDFGVGGNLFVAGQITGNAGGLTNLVYAPVTIAGTNVTVQTNSIAGTGQKTYTVNSTASSTITITNSGGGVPQVIGAYVGADQALTVSVGTAQSITELSQTVAGSTRYILDAQLVSVDSETVQTEKVKYDLNGGSATVSSMLVQGTIVNNNSGVFSGLTGYSLTDKYDNINGGNTNIVQLKGVIQFNGAGTFQIRAFRDNTTADAVSIKKNSYFTLTKL